MSNELIVMIKPNGDEIKVHKEDVEHRESLGWVKKKAKSKK